MLIDVGEFVTLWVPLFLRQMILGFIRKKKKLAKSKQICKPEYLVTP